MKILLISPNFFNYHKMIIEELEAMGHSVDWYDDRPSTNPWIKAVIRIKPTVIHYYIKEYFHKIKNTIKANQYDVVFLISGQSLSLNETMIKEIRKLQPSAKFVLYQWDSLKNFPYIEKMEKYFDKCFSFDKIDVSTHENLVFLPLFFVRRFENIGKTAKTSFQYDFSFIGTAHPQKYMFVKKMTQQLKMAYSSQFIYYYYPSRIVYFYRKVANKELRHARYNEFHFEPLSFNEYDKIYRESKCILDSPQSGQTGLTIRAIEALGANKKLITTNSDIKTYDFYRPENIYVYEGAFDYDAPFFNCPYKPIEESIYQKYSLRSWLKTILND